jgi:hypothetical protein
VREVRWAFLLHISNLFFHTGKAEVWCSLWKLQ